MTHKSIKLRISPTIKQRNKLLQMFGDARFVYNHLLAYQQWRYRHGLKRLDQDEMNDVITKLKSKKRYDWLKQSESIDFKLVSLHLYRDYQNFFYHDYNQPTFIKRKHNQTYAFKDVNNLRLQDNSYIKLPNIGNVRYQGVHNFDGKIQQVTVESHSNGEYYIILDIDTTNTQYNKTGRAIGIDIGLRNFATLSNGRKYRSLRFDGLEQKLRIWQRKYYRRRTNAKNSQREQEENNRKHSIEQDVKPWFLHPRVVFAKKRIDRIQSQINNRRSDYLQKLSTSLVKSYDVIVIEDLSDKIIQKDHRLAKAIEQQGWMMFRKMLVDKCLRYGKTLKIVKPNNTTQTCSNCGYQMNKHGRKIELKVEIWQCPNCNVKHDRDRNAAINILNQPAKETIE